MVITDKVLRSIELVEKVEAMLRVARNICDQDCKAYSDAHGYRMPLKPLEVLEHIERMKTKEKI